MVNEQPVNASSSRKAAKEAVRARILEVALSLFADRGFDGTSVRQIAARVGVSHGLLYAHFQSKTDLLRALMALTVRDVNQSLAAGSGGGPPAQRLQHLTAEGARLVREHLEFWRLTYAIRMQPAVLKVMIPWFGQWRGAVLEQLEALFEEAGFSDPGAEASLFFASLDGVCQHFALDPEHYPLEERTRALAALWEARMPSEQPRSP